MQYALFWVRVRRYCQAASAIPKAPPQFQLIHGPQGQPIDCPYNPTIPTALYSGGNRLLNFPFDFVAQLGIVFQQRLYCLSTLTQLGVVVFKPRARFL